MKSQISRNTHDEAKRYSGVFQQMGRMISDADWNELSDVHRDQLVRSLLDVIGSGTPPGGLVQLASGGMPAQLRWGRAYVQGVPARVAPAPEVELADPEVFDYAAQADFPAPPALPAPDYRWYLDVWERSVSALEDPELRDAGLHGADTCTRSQTMAQVKWCPLDVDPEDPAQNPPIGTATLSLRLRQGSTEADPCDPCADELALQEPVGSYLFRAEVHAVRYAADGTPEQIVVKWSSENGAEQYVAGDEPPGFAADDWAYEFFSGPGAGEASASEKHLGRHHATGWEPTLGILTSGYPASAPANRAHVRRWDGHATFSNTAGSWSLEEGFDRGTALSSSSSATAHGHVVEGADLELQLQNVVLTLHAGTSPLLSGDYWLAPVREAVHAAGSVLLDAAAPRGVRHHYMTLGTVSGGVFTAASSGACQRFEFPPLTDLRADTVCYDNTACSMPGVRTVQDALDQLCRQRDLKWHNQHLHGWGIVCGLVAQCACSRHGEGEQPEAEASGRTVCVTKGYAIDCAGNDIVLEENASVDVLQLIEAHDAASGAPILSDGNGTASLTLELHEGQPRIEVRPYDPSQGELSKLFEGTLLQEVLQHCVFDLLRALGLEFSFLETGNQPEPDGETGELISEQRKKLISFSNLIIQLVNSGNGSYVFLSRPEHQVLRALYLRLRELLKSQTFCGMFQGQEFPEYPFPESGMTTLFGMHRHTRLRVHPDGKRIYSYAGTDSVIGVYSLGDGQLIEVVSMPAPEGAVVSALEFSRDGSLLFATARIGDDDSVFGVARIADHHTWEKMTVLCDVDVTELRRAPKEAELLYAIGRGRGLFLLRPDVLLGETRVQPKPVYGFNAVGHLQLDPSSVFAFATAADPDDEPTSYSMVVGLDLSRVADAPGDGALALQPSFEVALGAGGDRRGVDGIALRSTQDSAQGGTRLYVVVNPTSGSFKELFTFDVTPQTGGSQQRASLNLENTPISLAYHTRRDQLIIACEDSYRLQVVDSSGARVVVPRVPVQIQPTDVAVHAEVDAVFTLNFLSTTVSVTPSSELDVSAALLDTLARYRVDVLTAFYRLFGGLLQYLKDCFCHHLLIQCPSCDADSPIYLGAVELRDGKVYRICNFDQRKYVKSFPSVGYWLSLVPVLPALRWLIGKFCCSILPDLFESKKEGVIKPPQPGAGATVAETHGNVISAQTTRKGVQAAEQLDVKATLRRQSKGLRVLGRLSADAAQSRVETRTPQTGIRKQALIDSDVASASAELRTRDIQVERVLRYDPQRAAEYATQFFSTPARIPAGSKVTLFERDGKVAFYTITRDESAGVPPEVLDKMRTELAELGKQRAALETSLDTLRTDLGGLREQRAREAAALVKLSEERVALSNSVTEIESRRATLGADLTALDASLADLALRHKELRAEIAKERPVREVTGVDPDVDARLREAGVRTVGELASAKLPELVAAGLAEATARQLVTAAKARLRSTS